MSSVWFYFIKSSSVQLQLVSIFNRRHSRRWRMVCTTPNKHTSVSVYPQRVTFLFDLSIPVQNLFRTINFGHSNVSPCGRHSVLLRASQFCCSHITFLVIFRGWVRNCIWEAMPDKKIRLGRFETSGYVLAGFI